MMGLLQKTTMIRTSDLKVLERFVKFALGKTSGSLAYDPSVDITAAQPSSLGEKGSKIIYTMQFPTKWFEDQVVIDTITMIRNGDYDEEDE